MAFCIASLKAVGVTEEDARVTAEVLVTTDTWGTFSHGTHHLPNYIQKIRAGGIDPKATPQIVNEGPVCAVIDGRNAIGMVGSSIAMNVAIEKARVSGIAYVAVRNSNHFGAAGYYANMAAEQGMFGIAMSNADANMAAPGARVPVVGNNPFAYAAPAGKEHPVLLDIALSATAASKIFTAKAQGTSLPDKWLVSPEGHPTSDIGDWPSTGSLMPMAGHKGYGLALMVEVLCAVLSGGAVTGEVKSWLSKMPEAPGTSHAFLAIDIVKLIGLDVFGQRMDKMIREIKDAPRAVGVDRVYLPGEIEWEKREEALKQGIALPETVISELTSLGRSIGTPFEPLLL